jgi:hypothetical protein
MAELPDSPAIHDGPEQRLLAAELAERLGHLLHKLTPRLTPSTAGNARVGSSGGFQFPLSVRVADVPGSYCRAAALGNQAAAAYSLLSRRGSFSRTRSVRTCSRASTR